MALPQRRSGSFLLAACIAATLRAAAVSAAELPVPCSAGACGATGPASWVSSGLAQFVQTGNVLTVTQGSSSATLNWQSFNIDADGRVVFQQPDAGSIALNRIFQADPSRIFGRLDANGRVFLLNQNGIVFGAGAQVNVGGLVASSLDLTPEAADLGIAGAIDRAAPAFGPYANGAPSGAIEIEAGAKISTTTGGQVLVFAPEITNQGEIRTPDGQIILGAGQRVFLLANTSVDLRGLLIEVGEGGTVTNGNPDAPATNIGQLVAERGNVTLAALAVNQFGRVSASTSVRSNGSIRLLARDTAQPRQSNIGELSFERSGTLQLGAGSTTAVELDATDESKSVDVNAQSKSSVEMYGGRVFVGADSLVRATSGSISIQALANPQAQIQDGDGTPDSSRVVIEEGATLDVSGASVELGVERNSLRVELRGSQLADFPLQRNGALRGEAVYVDVRRYGTRDDGSTWIGSPVGSVEGNITTIERGVQERNLAGGTIDIRSAGAVMIAQDATLDVSGGRIDWQAGYVKTSSVAGADGRIYDIAAADPNRVYTGVVGEQRFVDARWGFDGSFTLLGDPRGTFEQGYVEGKDAGTIALLAPRVAVDGRLVGETTAGRFQRDLPTSLLEGTYVPYTSLPRGATLRIGFDAPAGDGSLVNLVTSRIVFEAGRTLGSYRNADGSVFDPRVDALPEEFDTTWLRPQLVGDGAMRTLELYANGDVTVPDGAQLDLGPGGAMVVEAGRASVLGSVVAPGGRIALAARRTFAYAGGPGADAPRIEFGTGARADVAGLWTNDDITLGGARVEGAPVVTTGGTISATVDDGALVLAEGSVLDVSGGAFRSATGSVSGGRGGSITLRARPRGLLDPAPVELGGTLLGHALQRGGSVSLSVPSACVGVSDCADPDALRFAPEFFRTGGFASYTLATNRGDLVVAAGTTLAPRQSNFQLLDAARSASSGTSLRSISAIVELPDAVRRPTSITLDASTVVSVAASTVVDYSDLVLENGAAIVADPLANVTLSSNSRLLIGGNVSAPGGTVRLSLSSALDSGRFLADQGLWLEPTARIDVSGTTLLDSVAPEAPRTGRVLPGGSVTIDVTRGYVIAAQGSTIDVSGALGRLDVRQFGGLYAAQDVPSAGGTLSITTTEGLLLESTLAARGGTASAPGGTLLVAIDSRRNGDFSGTFPTTSRRVELVAGTAPFVVAPGAAVPQDLNGRAILPVPGVVRAGFDDVTLRARSTLDPAFNGVVASTAQIAIAPDVDFTTRGRLVLDAPEIRMSGAGAARLASSYLALGPTDRVLQERVPVARGAGDLTVSGRLVDLVGEVTFSGADRVALAATDALRMVGVSTFSGSDYLGRATFPGELAIAAGTTLGSTLTQYVVEAGDRIAWSSAANVAAPALTAGASLIFRAPEIDVDGSVIAPFGSLTFEAQTFRLGPNGRLAVSTSDTVPFGRIQAGREWVYEFENEVVRVYSPGESALPSGRVTIRAGEIETAPGSEIDVRGAGDLLAFEFVPGPTGTVDVLDAALAGEQFAILPANSSAYASLDPREYRGSSLRPGDSVWLDGLAGMPAGEYALLPARYALLPGALLVTAASGFGAIVPGERVTLPDGSTVVAGYRTVAGAGAREFTYDAFRVSDARTVANLALYDRSLANTFFDGSGNSAFRLPRDAGTLGLEATTKLRVQGTLSAAPATKGAAALIDVAASRLQIVAAAAAPPAAGVVQILDEELSNLARGSLLIGGRRLLSGGGVQITATAAEVEVDAGATLSGAELAIVATDLIRVGEGARIAATGAPTGDAATLSLAGSAALVRASTSDVAAFTRTDTAGAGARIEMAAGAAVEGSGSVLLAATGSSSLLGDVSTAGGAFIVDLAAVTLVDGVADAPDRLGVEQVNASAATRFALRTAGGLSFDGDYTLAVDTLELAGASLGGETPETRVVLQADVARLGGVAAAASPTTAVGSLSVQADSIELAGGRVALAFDAARLTAGTEPVAVLADGAVAALGDLAIEGGLAIADYGVDFSLDAVRSLTVSGGPSTAPTDGALGGALALSGGTVTIDGLVAAPSGRISVLADSPVGGQPAIVVGGDALLYASAPRLVVDDVVLPLDGGAISFSAVAGDIAVASGSRLQAAALGAGDGGSVSFSTPAGRLEVAGELALGGASGGVGGRFAADAASLDLGQLATVAASATDALTVRQRGPGSLVLGAGVTLTAGAVQLVAEQGGIDVAGTIDARRAAGGRVELHARDSIDVRGQVALAPTAAAIEAAPRLDANSLAGFRLLPGGTLDYGDARGGELWIRLPRDVLVQGGATTAGTAVRLDGAVVGTPRVTLEGNRVYADTLASGSIAAANVATTSVWYTDAQGFATASAGAGASIGTPLDVRVVPGIEIRRSVGNLALDADWNVAAWRFGGEAPVITLRAAGDLRMNRSLSDGFDSLAGATGFVLPETPGESASYRLVAGADLASIAPLSVLPAAASSGSVVVAAGTPRTNATSTVTYRMIRTGTGTIDVAAAGDLVLTNQASVIYTAGTSGAGIRIPGLPTSPGSPGLNNLAYPENGGDIRIAVGRDVIGPASRQLYSEWLWRTGAREGEQRARVTAWTVAFNFFEQGVAAFGGGDVSVVAGRSVHDLGVSLPSIGRQVGGLALAANRVEETGGGRLTVRAGDDITGGTYYVGRGTGKLVAGDSTTERVANSPTSFAPILALGDAQIDVQARRDLEIETLLNPTLVWQSARIGNQARSFFSTYSASSAVSMSATGGQVRIGTNSSQGSDFASFYRDTVVLSNEIAPRVAPPTVAAFAAGGSLQMGGSMTLWPAARGNLTLIARDDLVFDPVRTAPTMQVIVSDADVENYLPTPARPSGVLIGGEAAPNGVLATPYGSNPAFYAPDPVHSAAASADGTSDPEPVRIIAVNGDVSFLPNAGPQTNGLISSAKRVRVIAGRDVVSLGLRAQNVDAGDVSSIIAGRDVTYALVRDGTGRIQPSVRELGFGGPGSVEIVAGRDIDLQTSRGITSEGSVRNVAFAGQRGADVSLTAGLAGRVPDYDAFIAAYLADVGTYTKDLTAFVATVTGALPVSGADALQRFRALDREQQAVFLERVLFAELRAGGRSAAQPGAGNNDFTRAFTALETYYPGANPDTDAGETNAYEGDIRLVFSRVYTLFGGDVSLLVPGGAIDVGLASPPSAFGVTKGASDLGIVVQSAGNVNSLSYTDFLVNESRVFTGDGGDILVWSTRGDIDAGRGAKTAISAPPPVITVDQQGQLSVAFPAAFTGSGIQTIATTQGREPGDVDLFAPRGVVNAGDAGIVAGNLTIAATAVLGAGNISVSGTAVGVPVDTGGLGAALAGASSSSSAATSSATGDLAGGSAGGGKDETPLADTALRFLEVFVTGLGEEQCRPDDLECLRRQNKQ